MTEDEMVGWHHRLNGHEFEQAPGDGEGQGSLGSGRPWGQGATELVCGHRSPSSCHQVAGCVARRRTCPGGLGGAGHLWRPLKRNRAARNPSSEFKLT